MMKKTYAKPYIAFESFVLSTNIAGDCEPPYFTLISKNTCGIPEAVTFPGETPLVLFDTGVGNTSDCTAPGSGNELYNGLCYDNPSDNNNLFNS